MRRALLLLLCGGVCGLAGCDTGRSNAEPVTRRSSGPGPAYACVEPRLTGYGMRQFTETTPDGWRMHLQLLTSPPTGWYDKGQLEYAAGYLRYTPNGATLGIAEDQFDKALQPVLEICGAGPADDRSDK